MESSPEIYAASERLAHELNGHYMDQFTYAERATIGGATIQLRFDSIFSARMRNEPHPVPRFIVMSAGTAEPLRRLHKYSPPGYDTQLMAGGSGKLVFTLLAGSRRFTQPGGQ